MRLTSMMRKRGRSGLRPRGSLPSISLLPAKGSTPSVVVESSSPAPGDGEREDEPPPYPLESLSVPLFRGTLLAQEVFTARPPWWSRYQRETKFRSSRRSSRRDWRWRLPGVANPVLTSSSGSGRRDRDFPRPAARGSSAARAAFCPTARPDQCNRVTRNCRRESSGPSAEALRRLFTPSGEITARSPGRAGVHWRFLAWGSVPRARLPEDPRIALSSEQPARTAATAGRFDDRLLGERPFGYLFAMTVPMP